MIHSTGRGLTQVDFPGNDDAERPGWDGRVEAAQGTPWVPVGTSGWEFGTNEDPKRKADGDFEKSVKAVEDAKERAQTTFIFCTPRRWAGKLAWISQKKAKGLWKDVRVYDASDLEQWLEQSLPAQAWFANETGVPAQNVRSLDKSWADWANVCTPPLTPSLFDSAIEATKRGVLSLLTKPVDGPIQIAADSTEEALAYLAQLLSGPEFIPFRDRVLVFDQPGALTRLAAGSHALIAVVFTREVERELAPYAKSIRSFVIYPRNVSTCNPDVVLERANYEAFRKALEEMGKNADETSRLAVASGRSLTVLRRQLSNVPAVRSPEWASDTSAASALVPFLLVGAWNSNTEADKLGLSLLAAERPYDELEKECQALVQLNDAPLWSVGAYRGVTSKIDLLHAIGGAITSADLKRYFDVARLVLGEDDPALDLQDDQRWAALIHGKAREFSSAFRDGISETLVLLAVQGGHLFKNRLGIDSELEAIRVVRDLLKVPLTLRVLEANDRDLPTYAEAAPDEFLSILEHDLKSDAPAVLGLMRPVSAGSFGSPSYTGLLWALEGLSWNPSTMPRAAYVLARIAQVPINDNWSNKPINSLAAIFRSWMPQTAANHQQRLDVVKKLAEKFPDIGWKICVAQFGTDGGIGHYSHKPRWRPDAYGYGEPFPTWEPILAFKREMIRMALSWREHSLGKLCDLVDRVHSLDESDQARVWTLVEAWARTSASDADKAAMREKIRVSTMSRRAALRATKSGKSTRRPTASAAVYAALSPTDVVHKHAWLFQASWIEESADEIEDIDRLDYDKREERIREKRVAALRDTFVKCGVAGLLKLSDRSNASWIVGSLSAQAILTEKDVQDMVTLAMAPVSAGSAQVDSRRNLIGGALHGVTDDDRRRTLMSSLISTLPEDTAAQLCVLAPFRRSTWKWVDTLANVTRERYWATVVPSWVHDSDDEMIEAVERLMSANRPRAAFSCIRLRPTKVDVRLLFRILSAVARGGSDQPGEYALEQHGVEQAFKHLATSAAITLEEMAILEFAYIEALARPWGRGGGYGIPNLERYVEAHPEFFVQAIVWSYKRTDGGSDPSEFRLQPEQVEGMVKRAYRLLDGMRRTPFHNALGEPDAAYLANWITTVRRSCAELGRAEIADICIGKVLSHAPVGGDGVWPGEEARDVMEDVQSEALIRGAHTGVYNSRGVHSRGEGGSQERELAERYRMWGQALQVSHPFVAAKLLFDLAKTYDHEAIREDTEAGVIRRLR